LRLPLYIYLPEYISALKNKEGLLAKVLKDRGIFDKGEHEVILREPLLLLLDGFDEIEFEVGNIYQNQGWGIAGRDICMLITSRPEALMQKNLSVLFGVSRHFNQFSKYRKCYL